MYAAGGAGDALLPEMPSSGFARNTLVSQSLDSRLNNKNVFSRLQTSVWRNQPGAEMPAAPGDCRRRTYLDQLLALCPSDRRTRIQTNGNNRPASRLSAGRQFAPGVVRSASGHERFPGPVGGARAGGIEEVSLLPAEARSEAAATKAKWT